MIIDLQRRIAEVGRIRIGQTVNSKNGKRPTKLDTFRLTSADATRIGQAARLYGGQPAQWDAPAGKQWEVVTATDALNVIVPPSDMAFSQHYELWSGGGCQRRCDGNFESISDGPCLCDPENRECKIHSRLSVMLRDLPGLGVWRIDTSGYYAAVELQGAVEVIAMAADRGQMLPARLRLEQRMIKRQGQAVKRFAVPVLDIEVSPAQLISGAMPMIADGTPGTIAIEAPKQIDGASPLTPVPETTPQEPIAPVAEQAKTKRPRRKSTQQPIPKTGLAPRTVEQAKADVSTDRPATAEQNRKMHALFRELELTDRDDRLLVTGQILGRAIDTSKGLSLDDASKVIDEIETGWPAEAERMAKEQGRKVTVADVATDVLNRASLAAEGKSVEDQENTK